MTALASLVPGDAFVLLARVTAADPVAGMTLTYYGPAGDPQGTMVISPAGVFSGQLAADPAVVPVQPVPRFAAVSVGDVLVAQNTDGPTLVARRVRLQADGSYQWTATLTGGQWQTLDGWSVAAHVNL